MKLPRAAAAAIVALSVALAAGSPEQARGDQPTTPLRLVTFNAEILTAPRVRAGELQKYRFDHARTAHLERVAGLIETLRPDVLNLVEATSVEAIDRLVAILHEKGLTDYRGWHIESHDPFSGMDVGVISRFPLEETDVAAIRTIWSEEDDPTWRESFTFTGWDGETRTESASLSRNSLYSVTVAGWKLGLLGLHLKSNPDDAYSNARRMAEVELVRRVVRSEVVARGRVPIVLGDLNDYDPTIADADDSRATKTEALARLKDFDPDRPGDELINAAKWIPRQADRWTSHWDWNENGAPDGDDVYTMIDHVLLPEELEPHVRRVFVCRCVSLDTSDHFPVVVDLELPERVSSAR